MPEHEPTGRPAHRRPGFLWFVLIVIAINWILCSLQTCPRSGRNRRVTIPFSPYFVSQVEAGGVSPIASKGDTIQGTFRTRCATRRATEGDGDEAVCDGGPDVLEQRPAGRVAAGQGRPDQRAVDDPATSLLVRLLLGFGPTLLIVGLFVLFTRRAAKRGGGMGAPRRASGARRHAASTRRRSGHVRRRRRDRRGQGRADRDRRLPAQPDALWASRGPDAPRRPALRRARHRQDAARARGRG